MWPKRLLLLAGGTATAEDRDPASVRSTAAAPPPPRAASLAPLYVDDRAERTLVGTAATEIQAGQLAGNSADVLARQDRRRLPLQCGEIAHVVIEWLK